MSSVGRGGLAGSSRRWRNRRRNRPHGWQHHHRFGLLKHLAHGGINRHDAHYHLNHDVHEGFDFVRSRRGEGGGTNFPDRAGTDYLANVTKF